MKNLTLHCLLACEVQELQNCKWFCVDSNPENFDTYFYKDGTVYKVCVKSNKIIERYYLLHLYPSDVPAVVAMNYVAISNNVYLIFLNGEIITIENGQFELIGEVTKGLLAAEWSPDEELVVLVSADYKAMVMTSGFEPIVEVDIHQEGFGEKQFITVGWGKKETQFHGSEGKAAARAPSQYAPTLAFPWDDLTPRVRWRGDGTLFAISSLHPNTGCRQIRVFNREGALQSTSEAVPGLEHALDWRPSGSMIASTQRLPNKHIVAFFEKNGLRHGDITLPFKPEEVKVRELRWNSESTVLAVWCEGLEEDSQLCCLQLWASTNYHWHLKQVLNFPSNQRLCAFAWDKDRSNCLHVLQEGLRYLEYHWKWSTDHSRGVTEGDAATVAVMDGAQVKLSNFREAVIPPPMCGYSLHLPSTVGSVAFAPPTVSDDNSSNNVCVITGDNSLAVFKQHSGSELPGLSVSKAEDGLGFAEVGVRLRPASLSPLEWTTEARDQSYASTPLGLHHWLWLRPDLLMCAAPAPQCTSLLLIIEVADGKTRVRCSVKVDSPVLGLCALPGNQDAAVFTEGGYWRCDVEQATLEILKTPACTFHVAPARCLQFAVLEVEGVTTVLGLTSLGQLYLNDTVALKNCSSFFVHSQFLLLTTFQHQLLCIPRTKKALELLVRRGQAGPDGTERQVERGARLVVGVARHTRVVLQMPRGNLEAVQPRALALYIVQNLLDQTKYAEAFDLMRRQRINLNVFYDHNPSAFLANIKEFVKQVKNSNWLCLFITDLMEANVTQSMYAGYYPDHAPCVELGTTKLDLVCAKMRKTLEEEDRETLLLPIITTFVKQNVADIGAALQCIRSARLLEQQGRKLAVSSDEALNYLFYIVDVYELFDVALGLYDFDLVMMVAAKSQKDPKEYLPFLNELRKLEENYRRFSIDKHLKKYESALRHLSLCGDERFEECMTFIKAHSLYPAALKIFSRSHALYDRVCRSYGEVLVGERRHDEAGAMFSRSGSHAQAIEAYRKAGAWRRVLHILPKLQLSDDDLSRFYKELAHELRERRQFLDSAVVFGECLHDAEERVVSLCMARAWDEALRVTSAHNLHALADSLVRSGVVEHCDSVMAQLVTWQEQLRSQSSRLSKVREEKARRLEEEGEEVAANDECDMFSDTSSIQGSTKSRSSTSSSRGSSGKSYRSSKNKRKHERKLLSLKEGSPFEDLALVRVLHDLFSRAYQLRDEARSLCLSLLHFEMDQRAAELQANLATLLEDMEKRQADIWIPELAQNRAAALKCLGPDSTSNSLAAMMNVNPAVLSAAAELEPHLCLPPTMSHSSWKLSVLS